MNSHRYSENLYAFILFITKININYNYKNRIKKSFSTLKLPEIEDATNTSTPNPKCSTDKTTKLRTSVAEHITG